MRKPAILFLLITVHIICFGQPGTWTWVKGAMGEGDPGNIGVMGVTNSANYPEGRYQAGNWIDLNGNLWIFGGLDNMHEERNDLWKYDPVANTWTWINGPLTETGHGVYGTQGIPAAGNIPGARGWGMRTWTDQLGRLWLEGGKGYDQNGVDGLLDDMWMYDIGTGLWTWMQGSPNSSGGPVYGNLQVPAAMNEPGSRSECNTAWVKSDGTLWTFGGEGEDIYNDMWKYDVTTNEWAWMSGPQGSNIQVQSYGRLGVEAATNLPPARGTYTRWQDDNDNFYIYGGQEEVGVAMANDVWRYNTSTNRWTWVAGDTLPNNDGLYTSTCTPGGGRRPCARMENRTAAVNGCTNIFWTFGGLKWDGDMLNDLWNFNAQTSQWTWVNGDSMPGGAGSYGAMGVASTANEPPSRMGVSMWVDHTGALWVWGGFDIRQSGGFNAPKYSDMWRFVPDTACLHSALFVTMAGQLSDSIICPGDTAHLDMGGGHVMSVSPSAGAAILPDSSHVIFYPTTSTSYSVVVSGLCGGVDTFHYYIRVSNLIPVALAVFICPRDSYAFNGQFIHAAGVYRDTINNVSGCDTEIVLTLTITPPAINNISQPICPGGIVSFGGRSIAEAGVYTDSLITASGCDSIVVLTVSALPPAITYTSDSICSGQNILFAGRMLTQAGIYNDTLTGLEGCDSIINFTLTIAQNPQAGFSIEPFGDSIALGTISASSSSVDADSILWLLNEQLITLSKDSILPITDTGNYCIRLVAVSSEGCRDTSQQCIYVFANGFVMPTAFTPNGDGINDLFYPVMLHHNTIVKAFKLYNRWGQLVYDDPTHGWDGTYQGAAQPTGVYTYFVVVVTSAGEVHREGSCTLIR